MTVRALTLLIGFLVSAAAFAQTQPAPPSTENPAAIFCQQTYALCIKAPCSPIASRKPDGTFSIEQANCICDVLPGWSMGPGPCDKRAPVTVSGHTYLMSTYSNFYNKTNLTLSCPSSDQVWALCFGAPCVVDEKDPSKSVCTCPIKIGPAMTLGGNCRQEACKSIWSAATPQADNFANNNFYNYMTANNLQPPPNPPAKDCPATTTSQ
jgi:hypothetical protein